jgi:hypothetical protein
MIGHKKEYCDTHKQINMVNLDLDSKCMDCDNQYDFIVDNVKYCLEHCPKKRI